MNPLEPEAAARPRAPGPRIAIWRLMLGFAVAPLIACALMLSGEAPEGGQIGFILVFAALGAYPPALLFGVPALLLLRRQLRPRFITVALVGGSLRQPGPFCCSAWRQALVSPRSGRTSLTEMVI